MNGIIEATSLQAVTDIAANPPASLTAPTTVPAWPLTLYIARVPGSRDVFLTPLKPRDRIVTAEDVQSSLYYVHVNGVDDVVSETGEEWALREQDEDQQYERLRPKPMKENRPPNRRPLPTVPTDRMGNGMPSITSHGLSAWDTKRIARKPVGGSPALETDTAHSGLPVLPPRPLPAIPQDLKSIQLQSDPHTPYHQNNTIHQDPLQRSYTPTTHTTSSSQTNTHQPGSLTLIRRDPSSSEQWNVATIVDLPVDEISSSTLSQPGAARKVKKGGVPLYLHISNPAYAQFLRADSHMTDSSFASDCSEDTFRRRLYMPGSRYREHGYGYALSRPASSIFSGGLSQDDVAMKKSMRSSHPQESCQTKDQKVTADRRSKGYTFTSPWDMPCEFTTGATGRSLKCRTSASFSSSSSASTSHRGSAAADLELSELRFNLPTSSSTPSSTTSTSRNKTPTSRLSTLAEKRLSIPASSYFSHTRQPQGSAALDHGHAGDEIDIPSFVIDENGRIDLTLGRERAGGGFAGRAAKLGKLIIQPEGMKMLDLLVAANMGLWWRAYERV